MPIWYGHAMHEPATEYLPTEIRKRTFPGLLREMADPPRTLFIRGSLPSPEYRLLCVVGSRKYYSYSQTVCQNLISSLAGYPIAIVSGLALGIDSVAHEEALTAGLPTIALPGSGIDDSVLYPRMHVGLAQRILKAGGALISELPPKERATVWSFPRRNRLMAGMCHATLIIEAHEKSGTLITARLAMEYNRDVLIVPGPITSPHHAGSNALLREGAQAVTCAEDILQALGIPPHTGVSKKTFDDVLPDEHVVLQYLTEPRTIDEIAHTTHTPIAHINVIISTLEIKGYITTRLGKIERTV
ncbi:DNA-protecting protein DprA [Candidatus Campbellbacteria bacterium]|nr:MAG: DNA-protecting protein DprA [Candidatus Campbellbacteria bacterium]